MTTRHKKTAKHKKRNVAKGHTLSLREKMSRSKSTGPRLRSQTQRSLRSSKQKKKLIFRTEKNNYYLIFKTGKKNYYNYTLSPAHELSAPHADHQLHLEEAWKIEAHR